MNKPISSADDLYGYKIWYFALKEGEKFTLLKNGLLARAF
jgi:hypothetical protein